MNLEYDDPFIDASLEEVLGGQTPPDLTARIMQAWAMQHSDGGSPWQTPIAEPVANPMAPFVAPSPPSHASVSRSNRLPSSVEAPSVQLRDSSLRTSKRSRTWRFQAAIAATVLIGVGLGGTVLVVSRLPKGETIAVPQQVRTHRDIPNASAPSPKLAKVPQQKLPAEPLPPGPASPSSPLVNQNAHQRTVASPDIAPVEPNTRQDGNSPQVSLDQNRVVASSDAEILEFVNAAIAQTWTENNVTPATSADDSEWCRRVYLRVVGRIPTVEEVQHFLSDKSPAKREQLVSQLLADDQYITQYARHWSSIWTNVLIGRTGGSEGLANRTGLQQYLSRSFADNKPYDQIVYELLTATGASTPGAADYNGAVNFLLAGAKDDAALATGRTTRVFLGQQMQCAQCHHHPSADWTQHQFWALNSFFKQIRVEKSPEGALLVNADFASKTGDFQEAEIYYQQPNGELKAAYPQFPDGTAISPSGLVQEVNRREELARWIVKSDELPQALVNRLWAHFFGYGFTRPYDDMGDHNQPSHPAVLDRLSKEFVAHGYDMKKLIRWITLSDPFNRSSQIPSGNLAKADMPEAGTVPLFSHYYSRQMQAEEVYDSLLIAAKLRRESLDSPGAQQARLDWLAQFNRPMDTDEASEETHFNGSIRQSIIMMNGDLMRRAVNREDAGLLASVLRSSMTTNEKLEHLFLAALSRKPTKRELAAALQIVQRAGENESQALEDVWWALLNSNEFILDH